MGKILTVITLLVFSQASFSNSYSLENNENKGLICNPLKWSGTKLFVIYIKNRSTEGVFSFDEEENYWSFNYLDKKNSEIIEFEALYKFPGDMGGYTNTFRINRKTLQMIYGHYINSVWSPQREYQCRIKSVTEVLEKSGTWSTDQNQF